MKSTIKTCHTLMNTSAMPHAWHTAMMERFQLRRISAVPTSEGFVSSLRSVGSFSVNDLQALNVSSTRSILEASSRAADLHRLNKSRAFLLQAPWFRQPLRLWGQLQQSLSPFSPFGWLTMSRHFTRAIALVVYLIWSPFKIAFGECDAGKWANSLEITVWMIFLVDWLLTFNTAIIDDRGRLVTSRREISWHYLTHWCIPDLITLHGFIARSIRMPAWLDMSVTCASLAVQLVRVFLIAGLPWSLRALPSREKTQLASAYFSQYSRLPQIVWVLGLNLLLAHYVTCVWKLLANPVSKYAIHTCTEDYASRLVTALQLLQGQGVATESTAQRIFAPFAMLTGSAFLAITFGNVAVLISNFNANVNEYSRKMEYITAVMESNGLPPVLQDRIIQYYEYLWKEYKSLDGKVLQQLSKELSHTLELEVVLSKCAKLVMRVPFWKDCSPDFEKRLILHLKVRIYLPEDCVIRHGDTGDEFYMINRGSCELRSCAAAAHSNTGKVWPFASHGASPPNQLRTSTLKCGDTFGEMALIMNYPHADEVHAVSYVEMCVLRREDFQALLVQYPEDRKLVLSRMVIKCMKKNMLNRKPCALLQLVRNQFENDAMGLDEASGHLIDAINESSVQDETIKFGMDANFKVKANEDDAIVHLDKRLTQMEEAQVQMAGFLSSISSEIEVFHRLLQQIATP